MADRFLQAKHKVLFVVNGHVSKGTVISMVDKVEELAEFLPVLEKIVVLELSQGEEKPEWTSDKVKDLMVTCDDFLSSANQEEGSAPKPEHTPAPFVHPQFVLCSSDTDGMPKSIAHGAGNTLLQHAIHCCRSDSPNCKPLGWDWISALWIVTRARQ